MTLKLDLSEQEYDVFNLEAENTMLEIKHRNFIFGRNGAGKSTLSKMIVNQFETEFDLHVFTGLNNLIEDERLNALVLGEENVKVKKELPSIETKLSKYKSKKENLESKIKSLEWIEDYEEDGIKKHSDYIEKEKKEEELTRQTIEVDTFFQKKAAEIKLITNPQVVTPNYNKTHFLKDIPEAKKLDEIEKDESEKALKEEKKSEINTMYKIKDIKLQDLIKEVNLILEHEVKKTTVIAEIKDNPERQKFAQDGLNIHKAGENCSFCGNEINHERIKELESFISVSEVEKIETNISTMFKKIDKQEIQIKRIKELNKNDYYSNYNVYIKNINDQISFRKKEIENVLIQLKISLQERSSKIFQIVNKINVETTSDFSDVENKVNILIEKHNKWGENREEAQKLAIKKLRLHYVAQSLEEKDEYKKSWGSYIIEENNKRNLENSLKDITEKIDNEIAVIKGSDKDIKEGTIVYLKTEIKKLTIKKDELLKSQKSTYKLVEIINTKLKSSGKNNLELQLTRDENKIEHYIIKNVDSVRSIDKLSTGEKNIIGFLYFLESLNDIERKSGKNKIIVFDDPMTSNDDTMQYLIITELQKLFRGNESKKFNVNKDYFLCMTHNVHFYLNLQPAKNDRYRKSNFYRLENGEIKLVTSEKEDFNTHYESLWIELRSLYSYDLLNSMLNSMRRIVETYTKFNKIHPDHFYKNKEEHRKLFNENSHSIDDHFMDGMGKTKEELKRMFKDLFDFNDAKGHFLTHWPEEQA